MLRRLTQLSLTWWIFIGMGAGILLGYFAPEFAAGLKPLSTMFLRMIKSVVVPIIFGTLVVGIAGHGDDLKRIGRLAVKSISYFWLMTTIALAVGLIAVNITQPGVGVVLPPPDPNAAIPKAAPTTFGGFLEHVVPQSFFEAAVHNEVLQVVFWATLFAIALTQVRGRPKESMLAFCEGLMEVMFKFVSIVMRFAPIGIGAAMAVTVSHSGIQVLRNLGLLVATLYGALIVFALVALLPAALIARIPLRRFVRAVKDPAIIAFTTTSSDAALPLAMQRMTEFGVPRQHRGVRHADGLLVQPRRVDAVPRRGVDLRGAGGGRGSHGGPAALHDADAARHQQRHRRGAAGLAGGPLGHAHARSACRSKAWR